MTRGSKRLEPHDSIYGMAPVLLFDRFEWADRELVLSSLQGALRGGLPLWTFGGAYLFWAQRPDSGGRGEILYCGEAEDLSRRHEHHLRGPAGAGNKFGQLSTFFAMATGQLCGLALLVVPPSALPWLDSPDDGPVLEDGMEKLVGQQLEGLLLRAAINYAGGLPRFNERNDASRYHHHDDVPRYWSLLRYLFDHDDATMDFVTFWIRQEQREATEYAKQLVANCKQVQPATVPP